mgnify:CR=1 FL=1
MPRHRESFRVRRLRAADYRNQSVPVPVYRPLIIIIDSTDVTSSFSSWPRGTLRALSCSLADLRPNGFKQESLSFVHVHVHVHDLQPSSVLHSATQTAKPSLQTFARVCCASDTRFVSTVEFSLKRDRHADWSKRGQSIGGGSWRRDRLISVWIIRALCTTSTSLLGCLEHVFRRNSDFSLAEIICNCNVFMYLKNTFISSNKQRVLGEISEPD